MVTRNTKILVGVGAGILLLPSLLGGSAQTFSGGGGSFGSGVVTTPNTCGRSPMASPVNQLLDLPQVIIQESSLPMTAPAPADTASKKSSSDFSTGKIAVADGVYSNPLKSKKENLFNPAVPAYIDSSGKGISYSPTKSTPKKITQDFPTSVNPISLISGITKGITGLF